MSQPTGMQLVGAMTQIQWLQLGPVPQGLSTSGLLGSLQRLRHLDLQEVRCGAGVPEWTAITHLTALTTLSAPLGWFSAAAVDSRYRALLDTVDAYGNPVQPQAAHYGQVLAASHQQQQQQQGAVQAVGAAHSHLLPDLASSDDEGSSESEASEGDGVMDSDADTADSSEEEGDEIEEEEDSEDDAPGQGQPRHVAYVAEEDAGEAEQRLAARLLQEGARCPLPALQELRLISHGLASSLRLLACATGSVTHLAFGSYQVWGVEQQLLGACKQLRSLVLAVSDGQGRH